MKIILAKKIHHYVNETGRGYIFIRLNVKYFYPQKDSEIKLGNSLFCNLNSTHGHCVAFINVFTNIVIYV